MTKKILFVDQYSLIGGGQMILLQLLGICAKNGIEARVLAPGKGDLEAAIKEKFPTVQFVPLDEMGFQSGRKSLLDVVKFVLSGSKLLRHIEHFRWADTVYVNGPRFALAAAQMSLVLPRKYLYHIHLNHSRMEKKLLHCIGQIKATHKIVMASDFIKSKMGSTNPKFVVHSNSLPFELYAAPFVDRWSGRNQVTAVCVGRISEEKGQDLVIDLARKFPAVNFVIIGASDFQDKTFETNLRKQSPKNVNFFGKTMNLRATFEKLNAQISLVPSKWEEPFGLVAIEGMACSLITITSGRGELENISKKTGAFVARTESELENTFDEILRMDLHQKVALAQKQHRRTNEVYSPETYEKNWLQILN